MKIKLFALLAAVIVAGSCAVHSLSPAIDVMANDLSMTLSSVSGERITFSEEDFDKLAGIRLSSVTVLSLPEEGSLLLNGKKVDEGKVIDREELENLSYVFGKTGEESFTFGYMSLGRGYEATCYLCLLDSINLSPVFEESEEFRLVAAGSVLYDTLLASDPDGDDVFYRIERYPEQGTVKLYSKSEGAFSYTPDSGYVGTDSFSVVSYDRYGNESDPLEFCVESVSCKVGAFSDMKNSENESCALLLDEMGIMTGYRIGGISYFNPRGSVTREAFVAMAVALSGETVSSYSVTAFADEEQIDPSLLNAVSYAEKKGYLSIKEGEVISYFRPEEEMTVGEALSVLSKMTQKEVTSSVDPNEKLTREECARLLLCLAR